MINSFPSISTNIACRIEYSVKILITSNHDFLMAVIVNCAGDNELANKLYDYLGSEFSPTPADLISLKEDEIIIKHTQN